jgi:hypothetical protein
MMAAPTGTARRGVHVNPETRYAETVDGVFIAYQVVGDGPWTIVLIHSASSCPTAATRSTTG